jgi:hypothetical protein
MIDENRACGRMKIDRRNRHTRRKPSPEQLCSPQMSHDLTWDRTRTFTLGLRRLTASATARLLKFPQSRYAIPQLPRRLNFDCPLQLKSVNNWIKSYSRHTFSISALCCPAYVEDLRRADSPLTTSYENLINNIHIRLKLKALDLIYPFLAPYPNALSNPSHYFTKPVIKWT